MYNTPMPEIRITKEEILSKNWYILKKITFDYRKKDGTWQTQNREACDRGNGAVILLYNTQQRTVILTRQFRLPTFINGNASGMIIEACAGLLDADQPEVAIKRETEEETGCQIKEVTKIFESYMSPGSVTEILHFFVAEYSNEKKINEGGGLEDEDIDVLELPFGKALDMIKTGEIKDAKTIMLLYHAHVHKIL